MTTFILWCYIILCHVAPYEWWHMPPYFGLLWPLKTLNFPTTCPPYHRVKLMSAAICPLSTPTICCQVSYIRTNHVLPHLFIRSNDVQPRGPPTRREKCPSLFLFCHWFPLLHVSRNSRCFNARGSNLDKFNRNQSSMRYHNFERVSLVWLLITTHRSLDALMPWTSNVWDC